MNHDPKISLFSKLVWVLGSIMVGLVFLLYGVDVFATTGVGDAAMKKATDSLEATVNGGWTKVGMGVGVLISAVISLARQSFIPMAAGGLTCLVAVLLKNFIGTSFSALI